MFPTKNPQYAICSVPSSKRTDTIRNLLLNILVPKPKQILTHKLILLKKREKAACHRTQTQIFWVKALHMTHLTTALYWLLGLCVSLCMLSARKDIDLFISIIYIIRFIATSSVNKVKAEDW